MKKSLITAIKKLFAKLGAEDIQGNNLVEVIDNGADALDNGGGGGSSPLVVTFSGTTEGGDAACDKTWAEIEEAFNNGRQIIANYVYTVKDSNIVCTSLQVTTDMDRTDEVLTELLGEYVKHGSDAIKHFIFCAINDNSVVCEMIEY